MSSCATSTHDMDVNLSENVAFLMECFGFTDVTEVRQALFICNNDVNAAAEHLYSKKEEPFNNSNSSDCMAIVPVATCQPPPWMDSQGADFSTQVEAESSDSAVCPSAISVSHNSNSDISVLTNSVPVSFSKLLVEAKNNMFGERALLYLRPTDPLSKCLQEATRLCQEDEWLPLEEGFDGRQLITNVLPTYFTKLYLHFASTGSKSREGVHSVTMLFLDFLIARLRLSPPAPIPKELLRILCTIFNPDVTYHSLHKNNLPYKSDSFTTFDNCYGKTGVGKPPCFYLVNTINAFGYKGGFQVLRSLGERLYTQHCINSSMTTLPSQLEDDLDVTQSSGNINTILVELNALLMSFALCFDSLTDKALSHLKELLNRALYVIATLRVDQIKGRDNPIINLIISVRVLCSHSVLREELISGTQLNHFIELHRISQSSQSKELSSTAATTSSSDSSPPLKRPNTSASLAHTPLSSMTRLASRSSARIFNSLTGNASRDKAPAFLDTLYLDTLNCLLNSNRFDARMIGLREICHLIQDSRVSSSNKGVPDTPVGGSSDKLFQLGEMSSSCRRRQAVGENIVVEWLKEKKIVNIAMGSIDNSTYSDQLTELVLLLGERSLPLDIYDLWESRKGKPERIVRNINKMMLPLLCHRLKDSQLVDFWNVIRQTWSQYDAEKVRYSTLHFLCQVGSAFDDINRTRQVLVLLWDLGMMDETTKKSSHTSVSETSQTTSLVQVALDAILKILRANVHADQELMRPFADKAVAAMKVGKYTYHTVHFLKNLLETGVEKSSPRLAKRLLREFCQSFHLMKELLQSLFHCHSQTLQQHQRLKNQHNWQTLTASFVLNDGISHAQLINVHLQLLHYLLTKASQDLRKEDALNLWNNFISSFYMAEDIKEIVFQWLTSLVDELDTAVQEALLSEFEKLNPYTIRSEAAFLCFNALFESVNNSKSKLKVLKGKAQNYYIEKWDLTAYTFLWDIALHSCNHEVAHLAAEYILDLIWRKCDGLPKKDPVRAHKRFFHACKERIGKCLGTQTNSVAKAFAEVCLLSSKLPLLLGSKERMHTVKHMEQTFPPLAQLSMNTAQDVLPRCLQLCQSYIFMIESQSKIRRPFPPHGTTYHGVQLTFYVCVHQSSVGIVDASLVKKSIEGSQNASVEGFWNSDSCLNDCSGTNASERDDRRFCEANENLVWLGAKCDNPGAAHATFASNQENLLGMYQVTMDCHETLGRLRQRLQHCLMRRFHLLGQDNESANSSSCPSPTPVHFQTGDSASESELSVNGHNASLAGMALLRNPFHLQLFLDGEELSVHRDWQILDVLHIRCDAQLLCRLSGSTLSSNLSVEASAAAQSASTGSLHSLRSNSGSVFRFSIGNEKSSTSQLNHAASGKDTEPVQVAADPLRGELPSYVLAADGMVYEMLFRLANGGGPIASSNASCDKENSGSLTSGTGSSTLLKNTNEALADSSSPANSNVLFSQRLAWQLLEMLPTWAEMLPNAKELSQSECDAKLLYQLQIVNSLLQPMSDYTRPPSWRPRGSGTRSPLFSALGGVSSSSNKQGNSTYGRGISADNPSGRSSSSSNFPSSWSPWFSRSKSKNKLSSSLGAGTKFGSALSMVKSRSQPSSPSMRRKASTQSITGLNSSANFPPNASTHSAFLTLPRSQAPANKARPGGGFWSEFSSTTSLASQFSHVVQPLDDVALCNDLFSREKEWLHALLQILQRASTACIQDISMTNPRTYNKAIHPISKSTTLRRRREAVSEQAGRENVNLLNTDGETVSVEEDIMNSSSTLTEESASLSTHSSMEDTNSKSLFGSVDKTMQAPFSHDVVLLPPSFNRECSRFVLNNLSVLLLEEDDSHRSLCIKKRCNGLAESMPMEQARDFIRSLFMVCWYYSFPDPSKLPLKSVQPNYQDGNVAGQQWKWPSAVQSMEQRVQEQMRRNACEELVLTGLELLFTCVVSASSLFMFHLMHIESLEAYFMHMLVYSPLTRVRDSLSQYMVCLVRERRLLPASMASVKNELLHYVTTWNLPFWISSTTLSRSSAILSHCEAFFDVYTAYLGGTEPGLLQSMQINLHQLVLLECEWLQNFCPSSEPYQRIKVDDTLIACHLKTLAGLCRQSVNYLTEKDLRNCPTDYLVDVKELGKQLIRLLLLEYLFPAANIAKSNFSRFLSGSRQLDYLPKCGGSKARPASYELLKCLCWNCPENLQLVSDILIDLHHDRPLPGNPQGSNRSSKIIDSPVEDSTATIILQSQWNYMPDTKSRGVNEFMGLVNGGATCYMNSVVQQIFMVPGFCEELLALDSHTCLPEESLLYQIQMLMAHLLESRMKVYHPEKLWNVFKFSENRPFNKNEQQDAFEFFQTVIVSLIEECEKLKLPNVFERRFCGVFADVKLCEPCNHRFELEEPFLGINLPVLNISSLEESLEDYFAGAWLEGSEVYMCETCGEERRALKQATLKTLPLMLCLQLKRFDYDWHKGIPLKYNNYFRFPTTIDLGPYCTEALDARPSAQMNRHNSRLLEEENEGSQTQISPTQMDVEQSSTNDDTLSLQEETSNLSTVRFMLQDPDDPEVNGIHQSPKSKCHRQSSLTGKEKQRFTSGSSVGSTHAMGSPGSGINTIYHLVGVVVHQGSANAGHYYSFIKSRGKTVHVDPTRESWSVDNFRHSSAFHDSVTVEAGKMLSYARGNPHLFHHSRASTSGRPFASSGGAPSNGNAVSEEWYKFNDETVEKIKDFSEKFLEDHCFGGPLPDADVKDATANNQRNYNAYLLFYERAEVPGVSSHYSYTSRSGDETVTHSSINLLQSSRRRTSLRLSATGGSFGFVKRLDSQLHASPSSHPPHQKDSQRDRHCSGGSVSLPSPISSAYVSNSTPSSTGKLLTRISMSSGAPFVWEKALGTGYTTSVDGTSCTTSQVPPNTTPMRRVTTVTPGHAGDKKRQTMSGSYAEMKDLMNQHREARSLYTQDRMPVSISRYIREKNLMLVRDRDLFTSQYVIFMKDLLMQTVDRSPQRSDARILRIACRLYAHFVFNTLWRMNSHLNDKWPLVECSSSLKNMLKTTIPAAEEFLNYITHTGSYHLELFLLRCPNEFSSYSYHFIEFLECVFQHYRAKSNFQQILNILFTKITKLLTYPEFLDISSVQMLNVFICLWKVWNVLPHCGQWMLEQDVLHYTFLYLSGTSSFPHIIERNLEREVFLQKQPAYQVMCRLMKVALERTDIYSRNNPLYEWLALEAYQQPCPHDLWPVSDEAHLNCFGSSSSPSFLSIPNSVQENPRCCILSRMDPMHCLILNPGQHDRVLRLFSFGLQQAALACTPDRPLTEDEIAQSICSWIENNWLVSFKCIWHLLRLWEVLEATDEKCVSTLSQMTRLILCFPDDYYLVRMHLFLHGFTILQGEKPISCLEDEAIDAQPCIQEPNEERVQGFVGIVQANQHSDQLRAYQCIKFLLDCCNDNVEICEMVQDVAAEELRPVVEWLRSTLNDLDNMSCGEESTTSRPPRPSLSAISMEMEFGPGPGYSLLGRGSVSSVAMMTSPTSSCATNDNLQPTANDGQTKNNPIVNSALLRYPSVSGNLARAHHMWGSNRRSGMSRHNYCLFEVDPITDRTFIPRSGSHDRLSIGSTPMDLGETDDEEINF